MRTSGREDPKRPDWTELFTLAEGQGGYFTTDQAARAGYSRPLLHKYLANERFARVRRGIYRLVHFPASEHEDLVVFWLWSERAGTFSHETALALHDLSDALPAKAHLTVPAHWRERRLRVPPGLVLHYADLGHADREVHSVMPVTTPLRTLRDCLEADLAPDLLRQAIRQSRRRGLITAREDARLAAALDRAAA